jgi:hypothetical protein
MGKLSVLLVLFKTGAAALVNVQKMVLVSLV